MQRIEVTGEGITVTWVIEPLVSVFGKEMRPGGTSVHALPWDEISDVSLSVMELAPDGERWVELTVDVTCGEFLDVHESAEGFAEALRDLCGRSGIRVPDTATLPVGIGVIWPKGTSGQARSASK